MSSPAGFGAVAPAGRKVKSPASSRRGRLRATTVVAIVMESPVWKGQRRARNLLRRAKSTKRWHFPRRRLQPHQPLRLRRRRGEARLNQQVKQVSPGLHLAPGTRIKKTWRLR